MKKITCLLVVLFALGMILGGCQGQNNAVNKNNENNVKNENNEEPAPVQEPIVLKYNDYGPEQIDPAKFAKEAFEAIEERTDGLIKFQGYFGATLMEHADTMTGLSRGVADFSLMGATWSTGVHVLNTLPNYLNAIDDLPSPMAFTRAYWELMEKFPEIQQEMIDKSGVKWIALSSLHHYHLNTTEKLVKVPDDMKGLAIDTTGDSVDWVNSLGARAERLTPGDWYMSLETGLIDGQFMHFSAVRGFKLLEVLKHHTMIGAYTPMVGIMVNTDTWDEILPEYQAIIQEEFQKAMDKLTMSNGPKFDEVHENAIAQGNTIYYPTPEEKQLWIKSMAEFNQQFIEEANAAGYDGQAIYDEYNRLLEYYLENEPQFGHWD